MLTTKRTKEIFYTEIKHQMTPLAPPVPPVPLTSTHSSASVRMVLISATSTSRALICCHIVLRVATSGDGGRQYGSSDSGAIEKAAEWQWQQKRQWQHCSGSSGRGKLQLQSQQNSDGSGEAVELQ